MYFRMFYPLNLFTIKLNLWKNFLFLTYGFYMKHNQNETIFQMSYNSSSFDDIKSLPCGLSRHYVTSTNMTSSLLQKFRTSFIFDLYGIEKTCVNFDALVIIWTFSDFNSPTTSKKRE